MTIETRIKEAIYNKVCNTAMVNVKDLEEVSELVKDAKRYQFLREWLDSDKLIKEDCRGLYLVGREKMDEAIDNAMKQG